VTDFESALGGSGCLSGSLRMVLEEWGKGWELFLLWLLESGWMAMGVASVRLC